MDTKITQEPENMPGPGSPCSAWLGRVTDEQIDELVNALDGIAREWDQYVYGLPGDVEPSERMRDAVRLWFATLDAAP
jgi:hypothetical protein